MLVVRHRTVFLSESSVIALWQGYVVLRYFLQKPELSSYLKWQLVAELLDSLERDFLETFPNEPPVFPQGFREALFELVLK